jgi:putative glutamine amidotransferase
VRPLIGITASTDRAAWSVWSDEVSLLPQAYVRAVRAAGGRALVLPAGDAEAGLAGLLDGLVLAGGADLDPAVYGAEPAEHTTDVRPAQDEGELALLRAALDRDLPLLAVCRGTQLLAAAHGGRLHQHLPDAPGHEEHGAWGGRWSEHRVDLVPGSTMHDLLGPKVVVSSGHHQGVADVGRLTVSGRSPDGLVEAVEDPERTFVLGVQWHPEMLGMTALFEALVDAARSREASGGAAAPGTGSPRA